MCWLLWMYWMYYTCTHNRQFFLFHFHCHTSFPCPLISPPAPIGLVFKFLFTSLAVQLNPLYLALPNALPTRFATTLALQITCPPCVPLHSVSHCIALVLWPTPHNTYCHLGIFKPLGRTGGSSASKQQVDKTGFDWRAGVPCRSGYTHRLAALLLLFWFFF